MKTLTLELTNHRPLLIDFNLYTDGDIAFKKELISLMIDNIQDLRNAQQQAERQNDHSIFLKVCHKVKSTLSMLGDKEFEGVVARLSKASSNHDAHNPEDVSTLNTICYGVIKSLEVEIEVDHS